MLARALQTALGLGGLAPVSVAPLLLTRAFSKKAQAATAGLTEEERLAATKDASKKWAERVGLLHDLTGRTAFVTGAAQGIGAAVALGLARSGADVIIADIAHQDKMEGVVNQIKDLGRRAVGLVADVRHRQSMDQAVAEGAAALGSGPIEILVASAGIMGKLAKPHEVPHANWADVMAVNLEGSYNAARACYPHMAKAGRGEVVFISSIAGSRGAGTQLAYACSKGALLPMTKSLAAAWGKDNIQVNVLLPGAINSGLLDTMLAKKEMVDYILTRIPAGRIGVPDDLVGPALFLSSPASDYVTGAEIAVDGGGAALPMLSAQDPEAYKP